MNFGNGRQTASPDVPSLDASHFEYGPSTGRVAVSDSLTILHGIRASTEVHLPAERGGSAASFPKAPGMRTHATRFGYGAASADQGAAGSVPGIAALGTTVSRHNAILSRCMIPETNAAERRSNLDMPLFRSLCDPYVSIGNEGCQNLNADYISAAPGTHSGSIGSERSGNGGLAARNAFSATAERGNAALFRGKTREKEERREWA